MTRRYLLQAAFQANLDPFTPLLGKWEGSGTFFGRPATARYRLERVLGGRFVLLRYEALSPDQKVVFEGHGYYKTDGAGTWQDSQGNLYQIVWSAAPGGVTTTWNGAAGTSDYRLNDAGELVVNDRPSGGKPFASFRLRRRTRP